MKYKTLFRLLLKLLGVYFVAHSIIRNIGALYPFAFVMLSVSGGFVSVWHYVLRILPSVAEFIIGLYFFFGGKWIVDKAIPSNRPYCPECGYDLTGSVQRCSECGTPFDPDAVRPAVSDKNSAD